MNVHIILDVVAALCFVLAAIGIPAASTERLIALGLFFMVLAAIV